MTDLGTSGATLVREASVSDVAEMIALVGELAAYHGDVSTTTPDRLRADLFGPTPWAMALVAQDAAGLVGYAILVRIYNAQAGERAIDLHHLYVKETAQGAGIGRALIQGVFDTARRFDCRFVRVGVDPGNIDAQRFYQREGFTQQEPGGLRFRLDLRA